MIDKMDKDKKIQEPEDNMRYAEKKAVRMMNNGLNNQDDIDQLNNIDIDFLGFIFYKKSPRFIDHKIKISKINWYKIIWQT